MTIIAHPILNPISYFLNFFRINKYVFAEIHEKRIIFEIKSNFWGYKEHDIRII